MARWRLTAPHYLNVAGTEWQYTEVDRTTGRQKRTNFPVPMHLDPNNAQDWNHRYNQDEGEIIVSDGNNADPRDHVFSGPPTPDMVPLDDEAKAISASFADTWKTPIETLTGTYADTLMDTLQDEMEELRKAQMNQPTKVEGLSELLTAMAGMMKQNQDILNVLLAEKQASVQSEPKAARRA